MLCGVVFPQCRFVFYKYYMNELKNPLLIVLGISGLGEGMEGIFTHKYMGTQAGESEMIFINVMIH